MKCLTCNNTAVEEHHIIPKSQSGSNHPLNLAPLCRDCHFEIHSGIHSDRKQEILSKCYEQIKQDLSVCWKGRIKPKIVNILEYELKNGSSNE